jgi:hypothetical protein
MYSRAAKPGRVKLFSVKGATRLSQGATLPRPAVLQFLLNPLSGHAYAPKLLHKLLHVCASSIISYSRRPQTRPSFFYERSHLEVAWSSLTCYLPSFRPPSLLSQRYQAQSVLENAIVECLGIESGFNGRVSVVPLHSSLSSPSARRESSERVSSEFKFHGRLVLLGLLLRPLSSASKRIMTSFSCIGARIDRPVSTACTMSAALPPV